MTTPLLEINDLRVAYRNLRAVDGVNLTLERGRSLAIVGESGCGKSSLARAVLGLEPLGGGTIRLDGQALGRRRPRALQRRAQMVFQDPILSLNPRRRIRSILSELLRAHRIVPKDGVDARCEELMALVDLAPRTLDAYPRQLSGGQRQRVGIARALALEPDLLVADEPVSALDVSVQSTILALLADLQQRLDLGLLFISHDLGVVRHLCERVAVMYLGEIVEEGTRDEIFEAPQHPYTQALLRAAPSLVRPTPPGSGSLPGEPPSPTSLPAGCRFAARCAHALPSCHEEAPLLTSIDGGEHLVRCPVRPAYVARPVPFATTATA